MIFSQIIKDYFVFAKYALFSLVIFLGSCIEPPFKDPFADIDHLELGNPSEAQNAPSGLDNYLIIKPQYTLSYNSETATANWVSWHLSDIWLGSTDRQDDFRADTDIPEGWHRVSGSDYQGSGFDRGHLCPSADRTLDAEDNSSTFLMSNIVPQSPDNNRGPWAELESYCRTLVADGFLELYIIAGVYGKGGQGSEGNRQTIDSGNITVPARVWKVIVVLEKGENDLFRMDETVRVIAVDMPNRQGISNKDWKDYRVTVDDIEDKTGLDLLSNLPSDLQEALESKLDIE